MVPYPSEFESALVENFDVLYRMARSLLGPKDGVEDLVQESSLRAMRAFPRLRHHDNLRSWFARIVHTTFLDQLRYDQRRMAFPLDDHIQDVESQGLDGEEWEPEILREGFEDSLVDILAELSPGARAVVQLVDVEGFSYDEVAEALDIAVGTVRSRLFRARRQLYQALKPRDQLASDSRDTTSSEEQR